MTRAKAIDAGGLIDVSDWARKLSPMGIRHPVAITRRLYQQIHADALAREEEPRALVLHLLAVVQGDIGQACEAWIRGKGPEPEYIHATVTIDHEKIDLLIFYGPGDFGETVITVGYRGP